MSRYSPSWDLSTIPHEILKSEWARRNAMKRGKKDVDPQRRKYLDKKAESMRQLRKQQKGRSE